MVLLFLSFVLVFYFRLLSFVLSCLVSILYVRGCVSRSGSLSATITLTLTLTLTLNLILTLNP